jgi:hypothetical protein
MVGINQMFKSGMPWDKDRVALFTGDANPFTKNDDERAYDRFMAYDRPESRDAFNEAADIMMSLTPEQIKKANESNDINKAIPEDVMHDRTGQQLVEEMRKFRELVIRYEEP